MSVRLGSFVLCAIAIGGLLEGCGDDDKSDAKPEEEKKAEAEHGLTSEQASKTLVKVGDTVITVGDFAERLVDQSPYLRARFKSPERRQEFLDGLVRFELLAYEAERRGYDENEDVQRARKQAMVQEMMKELFEEKGIKLSDITDEEIKRYYEEHREEYNKPAQVRASHILISNKNKAQRVLKQVLANKNDMKLFRELAQKHNEDPDTKERYGDLRFFSKPEDRQEGEAELPAPVVKAAFSLEKTGSVHPELVKSEEGYHIIKKTGARAALKRSLKDARRTIQNRLWREKREAAINQFIDELRAKANVKENKALLSEVRVQTGKAPDGDDE